MARPKRIVDATTDDGKQYPIQPLNISTTNHFFEAFGNTETEVSARYIVLLCQIKNGWFPFTKQELDEISRENFWFNRLTSGRDESGEDGYVIRGADGQYRVTHEFIVNCFRSSPSM